MTDDEIYADFKTGSMSVSAIMRKYGKSRDAVHRTVRRVERRLRNESAGGIALCSPRLKNCIHWYLTCNGHDEAKIGPEYMLDAYVVTLQFLKKHIDFKAFSETQNVGKATLAELHNFINCP